MKRFNRIFPFLVCLVFIIGSATACGKKTGENEASESSSAASSVEDVSYKDAESSINNDKTSENSGEKTENDMSDTDGQAALNGNGTADNPNMVIAQDELAESDIIIQLFEMSSGLTLDENVIEALTNNGENNNSSNSTSQNENVNNADDSSVSNGNNNNSDNNSTGNNNSGSAGSGNNSNVTLTGDEKSFVITVYPDQAPITCENFDKLVNEGFYNGLQFYRVIRNFIAETGDPNNDGTGGASENIKGEFMANGVYNKLSHTKGVVSMDRDPSDMNSANSKFFICYDDNCKFMDGQYAAFGKVTEGMSVVDDFLSVERVYGSDGTESVPIEPITVKLAESIGNDSQGNPQYRFYVTY